MGASLDRIYRGAGWTSAFCVLAIAVLVSAQVLLNFVTRVFGVPLPSTIPSYADFSGFLLAAVTFLAMPYTFRSGGHIRVSLVTARMPDRLRLAVEIAVLAVGAALAAYAVRFIVMLTLESWHYGDVSSGIVPVPLWIPQTVMALGMALLAVAILHTLVETVHRRAPVIETGEEV